MALSVSPDRHRRLHRWEVVSDPEVHGGSFRPGVGPDCGRGLLLTPGGDRAGETDQTPDLGYRGPGEVQVNLHLSLMESFRENNRAINHSLMLTIVCLDPNFFLLFRLRFSDTLLVLHPSSG